MPKATRLGDNDTGHDACAPTALVTASTDVIINGKGAGRVGDSYAPHGCVAHPTHSGVIASGSASYGRLLPAAWLYMRCLKNSLYLGPTLGPTRLKNR